MYLLGYSLDNLSLMALTVATGFVVDDAIVVLENISRHMEDGMPRVQAALLGAQRGWVHRRVDQRVADRGVPADPADGRHRRPAVPGVRDDAVAGDHGLAGDFADHDADDVRAVPEARAPHQMPKTRTLFDRAQALLRAHAGLVVAPLACWSCWCWLGRSVLNVVLYVIVPKGFFPRAGHRAD